MSVVSTFSSYTTSNTSLSNIEYDMSIKSNQVLSLQQMAQQYQGNKEMVQQLHVQEVNLQNEIKKLERDYAIYKSRLESEEKMNKDAVSRTFKLNI